MRYHFRYWLFPSILAIVLIYMYFSTIPLIQELVSPTINREFGILEHVQLILLFFAAYYSFQGALKTSDLHKVLFLIMGIIMSFLSLEEIDYGLHYIELIRNETIVTEVRNIHNQEGVLYVMKDFIYYFVFLFFGILPWLKKYISHWKISEWIPKKWLALTAACLFLWSQLAQWLSHTDIPTNMSLHNNISEYEELLIYYIFFIYALNRVQIVKKNSKVDR